MALHVVGVIVPLVPFHSARAAVRRQEMPSVPSRRAEGTLHRRTEPWWMAAMSAQRSPLSSVRSSRVAMLEYSRGVWMCVGEGGGVAAKGYSGSPRVAPVRRVCGVVAVCALGAGLGVLGRVACGLVWAVGAGGGGFWRRWRGGRGGRCVGAVAGVVVARVLGCVVFAVGMARGVAVAT